MPTKRRTHLGIDDVHSELFPEDKLECIEDMKGKDGLVAMVGDGVNDAPALAASDVGIAMGARGVDVALESADVVLVKDELAQIPYLIKLSQKAMVIAKQNIAALTNYKIRFRRIGLVGVDAAVVYGCCRRRWINHAATAQHVTAGKNKVMLLSASYPPLYIDSRAGSTTQRIRRWQRISTENICHQRHQNAYR